MAGGDPQGQSRIGRTSAWLRATSLHGLWGCESGSRRYSRAPPNITFGGRTGSRPRPATARYPELRVNLAGGEASCEEKLQDVLFLLGQAMPSASHFVAHGMLRIRHCSGGRTSKSPFETLTSHTRNEAIKLCRGFSLPWRAAGSGCVATPAPRRTGPAFPIGSAVLVPATGRRCYCEQVPQPARGEGLGSLAP